MRRMNIPPTLVSILVALLVRAAHAQELGTGFTYQGRLLDNGSPASGMHDFELTLWDAQAGGSQIGSTHAIPNVDVRDGLFTLYINDVGQFGPTAFNGEERWLEIAACGPSPCGNPVTLQPRQRITPTPYALHLPHGVVPVVNVQDYGATGDCDCTDGCDDTAAVLAAVAAISDSGGILYFPEGTYCVYPGAVELDSNTTVLGAGWSSRIVRSNAVASNAGAFTVRGKTGVRFSQLSFDMNHVNNFATVLHFTGLGDPNDPNDATPCSNIVVDHCYFKTSGTPVLGETLQAVLARGVNGLWITRNRIEGLQIKAGAELTGGGGGGPGTFISHNYISDPHNYAVSYVARNSGDQFLDAVIADNVVVNPNNGAFFIGTDGSTYDTAALKRITVRDNLISGAWSSGGFGIVVRLALDSADVTIAGNVLDNTGEIQGTEGIIVKGTEAAPTSLRSLSITNNSIRNFDHAGIRVGCAVTGFVVANNRLIDTRGIRLWAHPHGPLRDGVVANNYAQGNGYGLYLLANDQDIGPVLVRDNVFKNHTGSSHGWGMLLECAAGRRIAADVIGNKCYDDHTGAPSDPKTQAYGIEETGDGDFDTRYLANDLRGNAIAGLHGIGSASVVRDNLGWRTENRGAATIVGGTTSVIVLHGLDVTPPVGSITVTPLNSPANAPGLIWVSDVSASAFQLNCANDPGDDLELGWSASIAQN